MSFVEDEVGAARAPVPPASTSVVRARRILYCIPGSWTDAWYDDPSAWWQWACVFLGWSVEAWRAFYGRWRTAPESKREQMSAESGLRFFNWELVPGGSIRGTVREAAEVLAADLGKLPQDADLTLIGHSKGGNVIKYLLSVPREWQGAKPARAIMVDAPVDWLRESVSWLMRVGIGPCRWPAAGCGVPVVTVNNWLDPSGGRLPGVPNYQTFVWQDYLNPYPPHGMKGFLAERVLRDLGALPPAPVSQERQAYTDAPDKEGSTSNP
jgi:hypothetical protein